MRRLGNPENSNDLRTLPCLLLPRECQKNPDATSMSRESRLFELLLGSQLVGVSALALAAVGRTRGETSLC